MRKLDHEWFRDVLNAHVCEPHHFDVKTAYGFLRGIYFMLQASGFEEYQVDRVIMEHIRPGYFIERMLPGDIYPRYRIENPYTDVARARESEQWDKSPFSNESEQKIRGLYSASAHSDAFWAVYETQWLPEREEFLRQTAPSSSVFRKWLGPAWISSNPDMFHA